MSESRRLAAILFTDIAGYTALMGKDEHMALETVNRFRTSIERRAPEHNGEIIQYYGDGCLLLFSSSVDAVAMAKQLQKDFNVPPAVPVRIGIHMGDVLLKEGNVYGDVVNIASRVQALAPPGGIYVTETVYINVANKKNIDTLYVKTETLKNVAEPARIYQVVMDGVSLIDTKPHANTKIISEKSIAVLPFVNMSNDPDQEYFSDGMAEEILTSLSHLNDLKVAGRTSSFQFKGKGIDLREVGEKLCVSTVLEGSVRKQGNRLRVTAKLVNVEDGFHMWSEKFDRDMDDIFAIQDEIAMAITENLKIIFLEKERSMIAKIQTVNNAAYELYLKGRYFYNRRGVNMKKALECFYQAAEIDPEFALAYSGIADVYVLLALFAMMPPHVAMPKAKSAAEKCIQLDPLRVEPYAALAFVSAFYEWDWNEARRKFQKAFDVNPNYAQTYNWYCTYVTFVENNLEEGLSAVLKNVDLEPLAPTPHNLKANVLDMIGRYEEAIDEITLSLELDPNFNFTYLWQVGIFIKMKKYDEALQSLDNEIKRFGRHQWALSILCWLMENAGKTAEAEKVLDELLLRKDTEYISGWFLFVAAYSLRKFDDAFEYLEMAYHEKAPMLLSCRSELWPMSQQLKADERFLEAIQKIDFPG